MTIRVDCPAKINTFLSVGPPDHLGYHPLRTVFQAIGLFDFITISDETQTDQVTSTWADLPLCNTLTRTLELIDELFRRPRLAVHLEKHIPIQSGLGGGSSDAAGLLRGLTRFIEAELSEKGLEAVALAVGADVPFFLVGGRARAEGYGERLTPLEDLPREWLVLARPVVGVSTQEAFERLDGVQRPWREFPDDPREFYNDFELVAPCACHELIARLAALGAEGGLLCGSGSAVFGRFTAKEDAQAVHERLLSERIQSWVAPTLTRSESLWMS